MDTNQSRVLIIREHKCIKCGSNEWFLITFKDGRKNRQRCASCTKKNVEVSKKAWVAKQPVGWRSRSKMSKKARERLRQLWHINKEKNLLRNKRWRSNNKDKCKESLKKFRQTERDTMTDRYIIQLIYEGLCNLSEKKIDRKDISQEDIRQYRKILTIKRELRDVKDKTT